MCKKIETPKTTKQKETLTTTLSETMVFTKKIKVEGSSSCGRIRTADFDELM